MHSGDTRRPNHCTGRHSTAAPARSVRSIARTINPGSVWPIRCRTWAASRKPSTSRRLPRARHGEPGRAARQHAVSATTPAPRRCSGSVAPAEAEAILRRQLSHPRRQEGEGRGHRRGRRVVGDGAATHGDGAGRAGPSRRGGNVPAPRPCPSCRPAAPARRGPCASWSISTTTGTAPSPTRPAPPAPPSGGYDSRLPVVSTHLSPVWFVAHFERPILVRDALRRDRHRRRPQRPDLRRLPGAGRHARRSCSNAATCSAARR